jgi:hypothetical protein
MHYKFRVEDESLVNCEYMTCIGGREQANKVLRLSVFANQTCDNYFLEYLGCPMCIARGALAGYAAPWGCICSELCVVLDSTVSLYFRGSDLIFLT